MNKTFLILATLTLSGCSWTDEDWQAFLIGTEGPTGGSSSYGTTGFDHSLYQQQQQIQWDMMQQPVIHQHHHGMP